MPVERELRLDGARTHEREARRAAGARDCSPTGSRRVPSDPFAGCVAIPAKLAPPPTRSRATADAARRSTLSSMRHTWAMRRTRVARQGRVKGFRIYAGRYGGGYDPASTMIKTAMLNSDAEIK